MTTIIRKFDDEYKFLSNYFPVFIEYKGLKFPSSEHAFQAEKAVSEQQRRMIQQSPTAGKAKILGKIITIKPEWESIKVKVMKEVQEAKYSNLYLKRKLIKTKQAILIEGNIWHDNFWGDCECIRCQHIIGQNNLGKILMELRKQYQKEEDMYYEE